MQNIVRNVVHYIVEWQCFVETFSSALVVLPIVPLLVMNHVTDWASFLESNRRKLRAKFGLVLFAFL